MSKSLVAFDTDQIKKYVFETRFLKEIRGASGLLDRLNRVDLKAEIDYLNGDTIYANGGAALAIVDQKDAELLISKVTKLYHQYTESASITGESVQIDGDVDDIGDELSLLRYKLRLKKDGGSNLFNNVHLPMTHPLLHICESCGYRYASKINEDDMICHSCQKKREWDGKILRGIERWTYPDSSPNSRELWPYLQRNLYEKKYPTEGYERPESFEDLAKFSKPQGYMGLIYADGDGMGKIIEKLKSREALKTFSNVVEEAVYTSVTEAIVKYLYPSANQRVWPFDILLLGGDDLVMVTQAQSAIPVALHIIEQFSERTAQYKHGPLKLSASVVIAHAKYPISSLIELAESGLKFAKKQGAKRRIKGEDIDSGLLNFMVVNNANHLDFSESYQKNLVITDGDHIFYRTQRPYSVDEMKKLLTKVKIARKLPRRKLEQLRMAVFKSKTQGSIDALKAVLRLRNPQQRQDLLRLVSEDPLEQVHIPWLRLSDESWQTAILDIVELIDFIDDRDHEIVDSEER